MVALRLGRRCTLANGSHSNVFVVQHVHEPYPGEWWTDMFGLFLASVVFIGLAAIFFKRLEPNFAKVL